jgi:hypothetical protein
VSRLWWPPWKVPVGDRRHRACAWRGIVDVISFPVRLVMCVS